MATMDPRRAAEAMEPAVEAATHLTQRTTKESDSGEEVRIIRETDVNQAAVKQTAPELPVTPPTITQRQQTPLQTNPPAPQTQQTDVQVIQEPVTSSPNTGDQQKTPVDRTIDVAPEIKQSEMSVQASVDTKHENGEARFVEHIKPPNVEVGGAQLFELMESISQTNTQQNPPT